MVVLPDTILTLVCITLTLALYHFIPLLHPGCTTLTLVYNGTCLGYYSNKYVLGYPFITIIKHIINGDLQSLCKTSCVLRSNSLA